MYTHNGGKESTEEKKWKKTKEKDTNLDASCVVLGHAYHSL